MPETRKIAVYGSLKKGFWNFNAFLTKSTSLGEGTVKGTMVLPAGYSYPHLFPIGSLFDGVHDSEHTVELYSVDEGIYRAISQMEGGAGYESNRLDIGGQIYTIFYNPIEMYRPTDRIITAYTKESLKELGVNV